MAALISPQPLAVGETIKNKLEQPTTSNPKHSYAAQLQQKQPATSKVDWVPVTVVHGQPTIEFTMDQVNEFIREEGLHQAVVMKFSYGKPELQEIRKTLSSQFDIEGRCNIGQLEYRHLLLRFDLFTDFVKFISKSTGYMKSKGEEFFFRTFPWTLDFNPKEETSMAVVWISFPGLPPNFFAKRSLLSIASAVGKPIAVDKATQERTRPSAARVKVILDLMDKHPKKVKIVMTDRVTGKSIERDQEVVYDNLPLYCTFCKHQGHQDKSCRVRQRQVEEKAVEEVTTDENNLPTDEVVILEKNQLDLAAATGVESVIADRAGETVQKAVAALPVAAAMVEKERIAIDRDDTAGKESAVVGPTLKEKSGKKAHMEQNIDKVAVSNGNKTTIVARLEEKDDKNGNPMAFNNIDEGHGNMDEVMAEREMESNVQIASASTNFLEEKDVKHAGHPCPLNMQQDAKEKQNAHARALPFSVGPSTHGMESVAFEKQQLSCKMDGKNEKEAGHVPLNDGKQSANVENYLNKDAKTFKHMDVGHVITKKNDFLHHAAYGKGTTKAIVATAGHFRGNRTNDLDSASVALICATDGVQQPDRASSDAHFLVTAVGAQILDNLNPLNAFNANKGFSLQGVNAKKFAGVGLNTSNHEVPSNGSFDRSINHSHNQVSLSMISSATKNPRGIDHAQEDDISDELEEAVNSKRKSWADIAEEHDEGEENSQDFGSTTRQGGKRNEGAVAELTPTNIIQAIVNVSAANHDRHEASFPEREQCFTDHERSLLDALGSPNHHKIGFLSGSKTTARKQKSVAKRQEPGSARKAKRDEPLWMFLQDEINQKLETNLRIASSHETKEDELIESCPEEATTIGDLSPKNTEEKKVTQEITLRQLPMRAAKQKGIASSTSSRSNISDKK